MFLKRYFLIGITIIFLSTGNCHSFIFNTKGKIQSPDYITNYLYGSVLYNQKQHNLAAKYFERTNKLQEQHFNFDVLHIEGKQNIEADALSRLSNLRNDIRTASPVYRYMRKNRYLNLSLTF